MTNNVRNKRLPEATKTASQHQPARRDFIAIAAGASGAVFWAFRRFPLRTVEASGSSGAVTIVQFSDLGQSTGKVSIARVVKPDAEWKKQLSPESCEATRHAGTEAAFTGSTWNNHDRGIYRCICCDNALFSSETKFESGTGWPSFWQPLAKENVIEIDDESYGISRTEVKCRECDAHLGHVFDDGSEPTGLRYCMNSAAMKFVKS